MIFKINFKTLFISLILLISSGFLYAANPIILDKADLLSEEEELSLTKTMEGILEYGGVAFVSNGKEDSYNGEASDLAKKYCREFFNGASGTVFLIDMYNRRIEIFSTGKIYQIINKTRANGIADNVYTYASAENYYDCARLVYEQMIQVLDGGEIFIPMRYVTNLLIAIGLVFFVIYLLAVKGRKSYSFNNDDLEVIKPSSTEKDDYLIPGKMVMTKEVKTTSSSGGSGGGRGGSSGGGGGGGGGGHSF